MTADEVKQLLHLEPLAIEGGFFRETYRSRWTVSAEYLPDGFRGSRSIGTAIYYMITPETFRRCIGCRARRSSIFMPEIRPSCCNFCPTERRVR